MVSPQQGCEQVLFVTSGKTRHGRLKFLGLTVVAAAIMSFPIPSVAREHGPAMTGSIDGMQKMTESDLSRVHARGLHDRYFDKVSRYLANGMAFEVLGDMGTLLNPLSALLQADITFKDAVFNPTNPQVIVDNDGSAYIRLPQSIGEINIRNIRIAGSKGASFGSVTIRDINLSGTIIRLTKR